METLITDAAADTKSTGSFPTVQYYDQTKYGHFPVDEVVPVAGKDDEKLFNFAVGFVDPQDTSVDYSALTPEIGKLDIYYRRRLMNNDTAESTALFTYEHVSISSHRCTEDDLQSKFYQSSFQDTDKIL